MTDKKFTDEEIIKSLECMLKMLNNNIVFSLGCGGCAFDNGLCSEICSKGIMKVTVDLINRQKAEIERQNRFIESQNELISKLALAGKNATAEAYKEFAEKLKKEALSDRGYDILQQGTIDNLLKEMVGEEE